MAKRTSLPPERSLAFQIRRAHLNFERLLAARLSPHGVKSGYYNYLRALWIKDDVTQRELSEATSVTETTTVALLKGMAEEGLIERYQDERDRRKLYVCLTEHGRSLETVLLPYAHQLNEIALKNVSKAELDACMAVVRKIVTNLEEALNSHEGDQPKKNSIRPRNFA